MKKTKIIAIIALLLALACMATACFKSAPIKTYEEGFEKEEALDAGEGFEDAADEADEEEDKPTDTEAEAQAQAAEKEEPVQKQRENEATETATEQHKKEEADIPEAKCTLFISCKNAVESDSLPESVRALLPEDGIIYPESEVVINEGENVFDLLTRETKRCKIHMEFKNTPMYESAYIEGIANLYEFDAGPLSGWMYKVNGVFPNYGCSQYALANGDKVEWVYTCDLGADVGNEYSEN